MKIKILVTTRFMSIICNKSFREEIVKVQYIVLIQMRIQNAVKHVR